MTIFISHSLKDKELLAVIQEKLVSHDLHLLIAEHILDFNRNILEKIKLLLEQCDVGLILLTKQGMNSQFVSEEIGYLEANRKPIIRIIEKGLSNQYSGFKYGTDYIELNPLDPSNTHNLLVNTLLLYKNKIKTRKDAWLIAGAVLLLIALSNSEDV